jgi:TolB-like protein/Flp pilus assembly protein TadD
MPETPSYQRFLAELKRRRVFRVAAVYGATAFVVVQAADVLQEALRLPAAFLTAVTVLALLGFPLAIVLAWAYDRTPQGVVRTGSATTEEIAEIVAQPASRRWPSGILALVGVVALAASAWLTLGRGPTPGSGAAAGDRDATEASIAVLPFANLSGDTETQPFADGLHDDLLTQLSKIGALTVISRTSVQEYRNTTKNVRDIAAELGVSTVLEGGVQRAGDQYRINVQLIDAETDAHLWAERYSGELTTANIFDVQTDIATSIAAALQANLTAGEREQLERLPTESLEAYQYYQRARERRRFYEETDLRTGDRLASQAIELDPEFAEAWALRAVIASEIYWFYYDRSDSVVAASDRMSRRALELAPGLAEGHWARGHYYYRTQLDYEPAMAEVERALESRPGESDFESLAGDILRRKGEMREALGRYERTVELAPRDPNTHFTSCETQRLLREYAEADASCERALELQPDYFAVHHQLALIRIAAAGDTATARRWLVEATTQGVGRASLELFQLYDLEMMARNPRAAVAVAASFEQGAHSNQFQYLPASLAAGLAHRLAGDSAASRAAFGEARVELQGLVDEDPTESRYRSALGLALAGLERNEEAIREGEAGLRLMPPEKEAWRGAWRLLDLARIEAMTGRHDAAIERLEYMLSVPSDISVWMLRLDPAWDPLRGNPRFEALVAEG